MWSAFLPERSADCSLDAGIGRQALAIRAAIPFVPWELNSWNFQRMRVCICCQRNNLPLPQPPLFCPHPLAPFLQDPYRDASSDWGRQWNSCGAVCSTFHGSGHPCTSGRKVFVRCWVRRFLSVWPVTEHEFLFLHLLLQRAQAIAMFRLNSPKNQRAPGHL